MYWYLIDWDVLLPHKVGYALTHTMQLVHSTCTSMDVHVTKVVLSACQPSQPHNLMAAACQALPDTALDAILHQLLFCQTLSFVVLRSSVLAWQADLMVKVQKTIMHSFTLSPDLHTG